MFPDKVTVFNMISDESNEYNKTVISNVLFVLDENTGRNKLGLTNADTVSVTMPMSAISGVDKSFISKNAFDSLPDDEKSNSFTISKGDFISNGDVSLDGLSINEYKNSNGNIYEVSGVAFYQFGNLQCIHVSAK